MTQNNLKMSELGAVDKQKAKTRIYLLAGLIIIVCIISAIAHWPCLSSTATVFDDRQYLHDNELVKNPSWSSVRLFFSEVLEPSSVMGYYHPLSMISLMLDYAMAGSTDNLSVFHRTSLILHIMNTALVIILLYILFENIFAAVLIGLVYTVHPLTVESVCWISDRKTLLASFFALFSVVCYVIYCKKSSKKVLGCSLFLYILALLSKPTIIGLPAMMLLLDWWLLKRFKVKSILEKVPFFLIGGLSLIITYISHARRAVVVVPDATEPFRVPMLMCHNMIFYLYKMVWPVRLTAHYPFPETVSLSEPMILAGVVGTCLLIPVLLLSLFKTRAVVTSWLIYFIMLLPTMQIIGFTLIIIASDKFAYFPSIGILMLLAFVISKLVGEISKINKRHIAVTGVILLIAGGEIYATRSYLDKWQESLKFYEYMISVTPDAGPPNNMLGYELNQLGRTAEAEQYFLKALRAHPNRFFAHNNLGTLYVKQGKFDQAVKHLEHANRVRPNFPGVQMNLAIVFMLQGDAENAKFYFKKALELRSDDPSSHYSLGTLLHREGKLEEAAEHYSQAVVLQPSYAQAWYNLGVVQQYLDQNEEAIESFTQCLKTQPNSAEVHNNLGSSLMAISEIEDAIVCFEKALELKPNFEKAIMNLKLAIEAKEKGPKGISPEIE
jgi:tetratricopeptide (TPR) repeat protein